MPVKCDFLRAGYIAGAALCACAATMAFSGAAVAQGTTSTSTTTVQTTTTPAPMTGTNTTTTTITTPATEQVMANEGQWPDYTMLADPFFSEFQLKRAQNWGLTDNELAHCAAIAHYACVPMADIVGQIENGKNTADLCFEYNISYWLVLNSTDTWKDKIRSYMTAYRNTGEGAIRDGGTLDAQFPMVTIPMIATSTITTTTPAPVSTDTTTTTTNSSSTTTVAPVLTPAPAAP